MLTMASLLERAARLYGKQPAIVDSEANMNWSQYVDRIARAAGLLSESGLGIGDRFAIISHNSFRYAELINAGYWLGAIPVPVNYRLAATEIQYILNDADCKLLVVEDDFIHLLDEDALTAWRDHVLYVAADNVNDDIKVPWPQYEKLLAASKPIRAHQAKQDDDAILLYTGGTTGRCKGVRLSHANLVSNGTQIALATRAYVNDRYLHVAPMFHSADLMGTAFTLVGAAHAYLREFSAQNLLQAIQQQHITVAMLAPTIIMLTLQEADFKNYDCSTIRLIFYGSAPMAVEWIKRCMESFPNAGLQQGYGLTETSPILTILTAEQHQQAIDSGNHELLRSVGKPIPHVDLRIVDEEDNELALGEIGEIVVRGPNVTRGYLGLTEQNKQTFRHGWFHTGDVGRLDEDYNLYLMDRMNDMIITGAENVYSSEVEAALYKHPAVHEVAVVGVPDEKWGEAVFAVIVPTQGQTLIEQEIIEHCRQYIGGFKIPRRIAIVEELPKNAMGKILKTELRRIYSKGQRVIDS